MYEWVKAFHLIAVISWMAGLLYLPRLFVYHAMVEPASARAETFKLMERRLLKAIMNPAMIVSWICGLWMLHLNVELLYLPWFWVKAFCVIGMTFCHMRFAKMRRELESDKARSDKIYRIWNEVPTILMVIIIFMAILKPNF